MWRALVRVARRLAAPPSFTCGLRASLRVNALYAELLIISKSGCARGASRCRCSRRALPPTHSCMAAGLHLPVAIYVRIRGSAVSERTYPERYEARQREAGSIPVGDSCAPWFSGNKAAGSSPRAGLCTFWHLLFFLCIRLFVFALSLSLPLCVFVLPSLLRLVCPRSRAGAAAGVGQPVVCG